MKTNNTTQELSREEKRKLKHREWYLKNREKCRQRDKIYQTSRKRKSVKTDWHKKNKTHLSEYAKKRRESETIEQRNNRLQKCREYHKFNKDKIYNYTKIKRKTNLQFKLRCIFSCRIHSALRDRSTYKLDETISLLGCSIEKAKQHIEQQFIKGMSWANYGKWHIDHIRPCASFDLTNEEQQKQCFNYTNLQPLWATDNLKKSSIYNGKKHFYAS